MTDLFTSLGKQVLANGVHYADASDVTAAGCIAEAMNRRWQPIETAPRDGTRILAVWGAQGFGAEEWIGIAQWRSAGSSTAAHWTIDGRWMPGPDPVFWMPLPAPPVTNKQGEA